MKMNSKTPLAELRAMANPLRRADELASLLNDFWSDDGSKIFHSDTYHAIVRPSFDEPEQKRLIIVPDPPIGPARMRDISSVFDFCREQVEKVLSQLSGIEPSAIDIVATTAWDRESYTLSEAPIRVTLHQAVSFFWRYLLRVPAGTHYKTAVRRLAPAWTDADEDGYAEPAYERLEAKDSKSEEDLFETLVDATAQDEPGMYLLYGSGGIGKTLFAKRLSARIAERWQKDGSLPFTIYLQLPKLLDRHSLEAILASREPFNRLPISCIRALIAHRAVVPVLDAFDELVRGDVRAGTIQFLEYLRDTYGGQGLMLITSRDYFFHQDPLIRDVFSTGISNKLLQFGLRCFDRQGRQTFLRKRSALSEGLASRWAKSLEKCTNTLRASMSEEEIDSLVGHPIFLDTFCRYIKSLPTESSASEAERFNFASGALFSTVVDKVLERERDKFSENWSREFGNQLSQEWREPPFSPQQQRQVLTEIALLVSKSPPRLDEKHREWRRSLLAQHLSDTSVDADKRDRVYWVKRFLQRLDFSPRADPALPERNAAAIEDQALSRIARFYLEHPLIYTGGEPPSDVVLAHRHRSYFDYFLSSELAERLRQTLKPVSRFDSFAELIDWAQQHHVMSDFATCLDFLLWDTELVREGHQLISAAIQEAIDRKDDTILSYSLPAMISLAMRRTATHGEAHFDAAENPQIHEIHLLNDLIPHISDLRVRALRVGKLITDVNTFENCSIFNSEIGELDIDGSKLTQVILQDVELRSLRISGSVTIRDSTLHVFSIDEQRPIDIEIRGNSRIFLSECKISPDLNEALKRLSKASVSFDKVQVDSTPSSDSERTPGQRLVDRLMGLARKDGHPEFGVFWHKLRGRVGLRGDKFQQAVDELSRHKAVTAR